MTFQESIDAARSALGRAEWEAARQELMRAESLAADDAQRALVALHRASIAVLRRDGNPDLRVFRENMVRRHSPRHVGLAGYYILIDALDRRAMDDLERYLPPFLDAARELAEPFWDNLAAEVVAAYDSLRGDHDAAIELQRATLADLDTYDGPDAQLTRVVTIHNLAYSCLAAHRYEEALAYAQDSLALGEQLGRRDLIAHILLNAAFATICMNRVGEAQGYVDRAAELLAGTRYERYVHYLRGDIARRRGDFDLAADHFAHLEDLYPGIPDLPEMLIGMNLAPFLLPE